MPKKTKKKVAKSFFAQKIFSFIRKFSGVLVTFSLSYLILEVLVVTGGNAEVLNNNIEIITIEQSFMPKNKTSSDFIQKKMCLFDDVNNGFLYAKEEPPIIIESQNLDANFIEQSLNIERNVVSAKLASLIESNVSFDIRPQDDSIFANIEKIDSLTSNNQEGHEKAYDLYEEELPQDVIDDNLQKEEEPKIHEEGYHVYKNHHDIKKMNISVFKKPLYFGSEPVIAIVIDDMGISPKRTKDIISLQAPITSSFLTYGRFLKKQISEAKASGHEIMIHVPMQPKKSVDIAPDTLKITMSDEEVKQGLEKMLKDFDGVTGANNHMGSLFTENKEKMSVVMEVLKNNNIFFLDSKTSGKSVGKAVAKEYDVSYANRHVFLDNENNADYILKQLALTEKIAQKNGFAVAIGHPKSQTYVALKQWLESLDNKQIKLVHLSDIVAVLNHKN